MGAGEGGLCALDAGIGIGLSNSGLRAFFGSLRARGIDVVAGFDHIGENDDFVVEDFSEAAVYGIEGSLFVLVYDGDTVGEGGEEEGMPGHDGHDAVGTGEDDFVGLHLDGFLCGGANLDCQGISGHVYAPWIDLAFSMTSSIVPQ